MLTFVLPFLLVLGSNPGVHACVLVCIRWSSRPEEHMDVRVYAYVCSLQLQAQVQMQPCRIVLTKDTKMSALHSF